MSDEPIKLAEGVGPSMAASGIYEHWCEHPGCKAWGGWGYGRRKDEPLRWFCGEHREDGERLL